MFLKLKNPLWTHSKDSIRPICEGFQGMELILV